MKLMSSRYSEPTVSIALLALRVVTGAEMVINHGMKKLTGFDNIVAGGFADPFNIGTKASLSLALFAELVCAAFLVLGLFTRLSTIPLIITMLTAIFVAHGGEFFGDSEKPVLFLMIFFTLLLTGPGKYSLDAKIGK